MAPGASKIVMVLVEFILLILAFFTGEEFAPLAKLERRIEREMAWAQFTYDYSQNQWCVNAQRRDAQPGEYVGGCWPTRYEADEGILHK